MMTPNIKVNDKLFKKSTLNLKFEKTDELNL